VTATVWRLLLTPDRPGTWNMACDHALAEAAARGAGPVLRLYGWSPHAVSVGYAQPLRRLAAAVAALRRRGLDVVRRPTGGGAVLHARELTYSVALPAGRGRGLRPREACAAIHRALARGLARLGIEDLQVGGAGAAADAAAAASPGARRAAICFRALGESEVAWRGRKLVGSAQRRLGAALLQHGSIPLAGGAEAADALIALEDTTPGRAADAPPGARSPEAPEGDAPGARVAADLERAAGREISHVDASDAVAAGFAAELGVRFEPAPLAPDEEARIACLVRERYGTEAFLLRV
jgi:lipoate-protein ligase A